MINDEQESRQLIATRTSWKTEPLPASYTPLHIDRTFTAYEYEKLSYGFIPDSMDDHWFIYLDLGENVLYFHRSWTGFCFCKVRIERGGNLFEVAEVLVNRDPGQYDGTDDENDAALICWLIDKFLLGKDTPFPLPGNKPQQPITNLRRSTDKQS